jgi:hypothetical protein
MTLTGQWEPRGTTQTPDGAPPISAERLKTFSLLLRFEHGQAQRCSSPSGQYRPSSGHGRLMQHLSGYHQES